MVKKQILTTLSTLDTALTILSVPISPTPLDICLSSPHGPLSVYKIRKGKQEQDFSSGFQKSTPARTKSPPQGQPRQSSLKTLSET